MSQVSRPTVPVLLMNPTEGATPMARRRTTKKRTARRKTTARRRTTRRAAPRRRTTRRRRRKNPMKQFAVKETLQAGAAGALVGAGAYALQSQPLSAEMQAGILAAGALVLGGLASGWNKSVGAGIAGAGIALGAKMAADIYTAQAATSGLGRIPNYAYQKFGHTPVHPAYHNLPMGAIRADLGAVQAPIGQYDAMLNGMEAELV